MTQATETAPRPQAARTDQVRHGRIGGSIGGWIRTHWIGIAVALLAVLLIRLSTPVAGPTNDAIEYLKVAASGLRADAQLGAPFVYRFAVPLFVHGLALVTGAEPTAIFPVMAFVTCVLLLIAVYAVAVLAGASRAQAVLIQLVLAASLFVIRFPLSSPFMVDAEAVALSFGIFILLQQRRTMPALACALIGLLFKEFLLAPIAALIGWSLLEYFRERTVAPLRTAVIALLLTLALFVLPRLLIPVTYGFGTFIRLRSPEPSQTLYMSSLRTLLSWPPKLGTPVNMLLALVSFWLPALMLMTPARARAAWQAIGSQQVIVALWMTAVILLMAVGGTNIMVFAVYTAPILVLMLALIMRQGVSSVEAAAVLIATVLFNRMLFTVLTPSGELDLELGFYGAYWHKLSDVTAWRFAEAAGWILLGWASRRVPRGASS